MTVPTRKVAQTFVNVQTGVDVNCDWPLKSEDEVVVIYGKASIKAVKNVDYVVVLLGPDYLTFRITPILSLITKINALIAIDGTETNYITVRRKTDSLSSVSKDNVHDTTYLQTEIERLWLNIQELDEQISGAATLEARYIGNIDGPVSIGLPVPGTILVANDAGTGYEAGPLIASVEAIVANADAVAASAAIAVAAAATAASYAASLIGTSTSNLAIATGAKVFVTQANKQWIAGMRVRAASADGTKVMEGLVASYVGTTLTLTVDVILGAGNFAVWNLSISGSQGSQGIQGVAGPAGPGSGDMLAAQNLNDLANKATSRTNLGVQIGLNVQAWSAKLDTLAALASIANLTAEAGLVGAADNISYYTGVGAKALTALTAYGRSLMGAADAAAARTLLGVVPDVYAYGNGNTGASVVANGLTFGKIAVGRYRFTFSVAKLNTNYIPTYSTETSQEIYGKTVTKTVNYFEVNTTALNVTVNHINQLGDTDFIAARVTG